MDGIPTGDKAKSIPGGTVQVNIKVARHSNCIVAEYTHLGYGDKANPKNKALNLSVKLCEYSHCQR